jgi:ribonuclease P protein component
LVTAATLSSRAPGPVTPPLRRGDFRRVTQEGRRAAGQWVTLYVAPRPDHLVRIGFTAGKRVGGAVVRNRARRLMREAWRAVAGRAGGGFDLVFAARTGIDRRKAGDVAAELASLLRRVGVIG